MFYTIYQITNNLNGKYYIGKHRSSILLDAYYGSGKAIVNAIKLYGKDNFSKEILFVFDNECDMDIKEREIITEELVNDPNCYNLGIGGEGGPHFAGKRHSVETKEKIADIRTGVSTITPAGREKIISKNSTRGVSELTRQRIKEKALLRNQSSSYKERISESMKNYHANRKESLPK